MKRSRNWLQIPGRFEPRPELSKIRPCCRGVGKLMLTKQLREISFRMRRYQGDDPHLVYGFPYGVQAT